MITLSKSITAFAQSGWQKISSVGVECLNDAMPYGERRYPCGNLRPGTHDWHMLPSKDRYQSLPMAIR